MRPSVEVAPGVHVFTSRRYATTSTLVMGAHEALVVDPAWDADELAGVAEAVRALGIPATGGLATHLHYDHVLWHPELPEVPRWASREAVEAWRTDRDRLIAPLIGDLPEDLLALAGRLNPLDGVIWSGRELAVHQHNAHAVGHLAVELPDVGVLLAGDMLSDIELPMPDPDAVDLADYLAGLDVLAPVVTRCSMLVPGHGSPTDRPIERLDADRRYLDDVLADRTPTDARMALPGMADLHARTVQQARGIPVRDDAEQ